MPGYLKTIGGSGAPVTSRNAAGDYETISAKEMNALVNDWCAGRPIPRRRYLCQDGKKWVGMDNTSGNCYVEEFDNMNLAIAWVMDLCDSEGVFY